MHVWKVKELLIVLWNGIYFTFICIMDLVKVKNDIRMYLAEKNIILVFTFIVVIIWEETCTTSSIGISIDLVNDTKISLYGYL